MTSSTPTAVAVQFFAEHLPRHAELHRQSLPLSSNRETMRYARELVRAERDACSLGFRFEWGDVRTDTVGNEIAKCFVYDDDDRCIASSGEFVAPTDQSMRIIEAQVALEYFNSADVFRPPLGVVHERTL